MADVFSIKFDPSQMLAGLDEKVEKAKQAVRPAAQAGAQVYYNEVTLNVSRIGKVTGNLAASIYQVYSKDNSTPTKATYHISWNAKKAPHGHLVEFGHLMTRKAYIGSDGKWYTSKELLDNPKQVGARPFVRPAYSRAQEALQVGYSRFITEYNK
jgi:hypothetical protein